MDAMYFRQLKKGASLPERMAAFKCDVRWYRIHADDANQNADRAISDITYFSDELTEAGKGVA